MEYVLTGIEINAIHTVEGIGCIVSTTFGGFNMIPLTVIYTDRDVGPFTRLHRDCNTKAKGIVAVDGCLERHLVGRRICPNLCNGVLIVTAPQGEKAAAVHRKARFGIVGRKGAA